MFEKVVFLSEKVCRFLKGGLTSAVTSFLLGRTRNANIIGKFLNLQSVPMDPEYCSTISYHMEMA